MSSLPRRPALSCVVHDRRQAFASAHLAVLERRLPRLGVVAVAGLLFAAVFGLRLGHGAADATLVLFVVPIALCAFAFGLRGGLLASLFAVGLLLGSETVRDQQVGAFGIATRATAYFVVGGLLGRFIDERRALEAQVNRHYDLSLDLLCTATFDGCFERLNPAWERVLGYTQSQLTSRPFVEFVHPDDRERTAAETIALADTDDELWLMRQHVSIGASILKDAVAEIERLSGQHFDPRVVKAFGALEHRRLLEPLEHLTRNRFRHRCLRPKPAASRRLSSQRRGRPGSGDGHGCTMLAG